MGQYRELAAFAQFGTELDKSSEAQLALGRRMEEILKQGKNSPLPVEDQLVIIYAGINRFLDDVALEDVQEFEKGLIKYVNDKHKDVIDDLKKEKKFTDTINKKLDKVIAEYRAAFKK